MLWLACAGAGLAAQNLTVVASGQPAATIVLASQPTRVAQFAAADAFRLLTRSLQQGQSGGPMPERSRHRAFRRRHPRRRMQY